jgi:hypothetical protein
MAYGMDFVTPPVHGAAVHVPTFRPKTHCVAIGAGVVETLPLDLAGGADARAAAACPTTPGKKSSVGIMAHLKCRGGSVSRKSM